MQKLCDTSCNKIAEKPQGAPHRLETSTQIHFMSTALIKPNSINYHMISSTSIHVILIGYPFTLHTRHTTHVKTLGIAINNHHMSLNWLQHCRAFLSVSCCLLRFRFCTPECHVWDILPCAPSRSKLLYNKV